MKKRIQDLINENNKEIEQLINKEHMTIEDMERITDLCVECSRLQQKLIEVCNKNIKAVYGV
jgi:hypothetical protein